MRPWLRDLWLVGAPYTRPMHPRYRRLVISGALLGLIVIVVVAKLLK
jgi:hypothetical protein